MKKKYDTVIFDLDGTLLNTIEDLTDAVNYVMEKYGYHQWSVSDIRSFVGNGIRKLMIEATPQGEKNPQFEDIFCSFREYYNTHCAIRTAPYPGILNLLEELKKDGYQMAIVSNKIQAAVEELNKIYFQDFITVAMGEQQNIRRKPAPDSVLEVLRKLDRPIESAIYVGDSEVDIRTAQNAGMDYVLVTWGFRDKEQLEMYHPNAMIDTVSQLSDLLRQR